jgi:hypothetical protein
MNIAVKIEADPETAEALAMPLADINPAKVERFQADTIWPYFERLRREDPVHFTADSEFGPYWSITRWDDIMAVDTDHEAFSSADGIGLPNRQAMEEQDKVFAQMGHERRRSGAGFITMDEPEHSVHRKAVSPTVAPANIAKMAPVVRRGDPRQPAHRRAVRLGRQGVEGTDGHDPGHAVRLPLRGPAQADALVGHVHQHAGPWAGGELAAEGRGRVRVLRRLQGAVERAGQR